MTEPDYSVIEAETKRHMIDAYWDDVAERVEYLNELVKRGRFTEALTLCSTYLDGVASVLAPAGSKNGPAFCAALVAHEDSPYFSLIHPLQAIRETGRLGGDWPAISSKLATVFPGRQYDLHTEADFMAAVKGSLSASECALLAPELWRASLAGIAYYWIRNPAVHELGGASTIGFSTSYYLGKPVASMSLPEFMPVLRKMIAAARANSHAKGAWP